MTDDQPTSERLQSLQWRWESDKGSRLFLQLADEYRRLGRPADAVRVLDEGLETNKGHVGARVARARCLLSLDRSKEAADDLEKVIESDPTQMVAYRLLVEAYIRLQKPDQARQRLSVYGLLNDSDPDIPDLDKKIRQLERAERTGEWPIHAPGPPKETPKGEAGKTGPAHEEADPALGAADDPFGELPGEDELPAFDEPEMLEPEPAEGGLQAGEDADADGASTERDGAPELRSGAEPEAATEEPAEGPAAGAMGEAAAEAAEPPAEPPVAEPFAPAAPVEPSPPSVLDPFPSLQLPEDERRYRTPADGDLFAAPESSLPETEADTEPQTGSETSPEVEASPEVIEPTAPEPARAEAAGPMPSADAPARSEGAAPGPATSDSGTGGDDPFDLPASSAGDVPDLAASLLGSGEGEPAPRSSEPPPSGATDELASEPSEPPPIERSAGSSPEPEGVSDSPQEPFAEQSPEEPSEDGDELGVGGAPEAPEDGPDLEAADLEAAERQVEGAEASQLGAAGDAEIEPEADVEPEAPFDLPPAAEAEPAGGGPPAEASTDEAPSEVAAEPGEQRGEAAPRSAEEEGRATVTLGRLYLGQGHLQEAEEIFREVLEREPENEAAREGLEEVALHRAPGLAAEELLAGYEPGDHGEGLTSRKRYALQRYLARLREGGSHVH